MTRLLALVGSGLLWAVMMIALFRREVLPYFAYQAPPSYRDVLKDLRTAELTKGEVLAAGVHVGEIETLAERLFDGNYRIRTRASMKARILGTGDQSTDQIPLKLKSESNIDVLYRLSRSWCEIDIGFGIARIEAARQDKFLNVKLLFGQGSRTSGGVSQKLEFPKEGMIGDMFQPFPGGGSLFVGKKWKIPTITLSGTGPSVGWLYASVTDREIILWDNQEVDTLRVEIRTEPTEEKRPTHISWCRSDGVALKQQMTFQSLVYEIVLISREPRTRAEAIGWGRRYFGSD
jgi:hypothetical protein